MNNLNIIFSLFIISIAGILFSLEYYIKTDSNYIKNICNDIESDNKSEKYKDFIYNYPSWRIALNISFFTVIIITIISYVIIVKSNLYDINDIWNKMLLIFIMLFLIIYILTEHNIKNFKKMIYCNKL